MSEIVLMDFNFSLLSKQKYVLRRIESKSSKRKGVIAFDYSSPIKEMNWWSNDPKGTNRIQIHPE